MSKKHYLYHSSYCQFSKEAIESIYKKSLQNEFNLTNIDSGNGNIPTCVDRVPLIITNNKEIITDDNLFRFIEGLHKKNMQNSNNEEIQPFSMLGAINTSLSDAYSFIDERDNNETIYNDNSSRGFQFIEDKLNIQTPDEDGFQKNQDYNTGVNNSEYDKLIQSRDKDLTSLFGKKPMPYQ